VVLIWQGVPQTLRGHVPATAVQGATQTIARGPVASQEAIENLSMDGGGFYNSNSAVPFENPTGHSNFVELPSLTLP
jgi:potassium-transporting ATPase potassium-binding subunit